MTNRVKMLRQEATTSEGDSHSCWLMKAEPDSRVVKGKDVAFSAEIFEEMGTSPWDGVRNAVAKNYMKVSMKVGDTVLFYHSNCKVPGIAAIAEVCREGYPDYTAWDSGHPYFDPKSDEKSPKWYMVDVKFLSKLPHFVPLKLLQSITTLTYESLPSYLTPDHRAAIKAMPLLAKGQRLSVQPVSETAFEAVSLLGENGGWQDLLESEEARKKEIKKAATAEKKGKKKSAEADSDDTAETAAQPSRQSKRPKTEKSKADREGSEKAGSGEMEVKPKRGRKPKAK